MTILQKEAEENAEIEEMKNLPFLVVAVRLKCVTVSLTSIFRNLYSCYSYLSRIVLCYSILFQVDGS